MKLTQQVRERARMKKEADVERGACGQEKSESNELCRTFRYWKRVSTCVSTAMKAKQNINTH